MNVNDMVKVAGAGTPDKLVTKKELRSVYGIPYAPQHIAKLEKAGKFPRRLKLGENRVAWLCREVEAWIAARAAHRVSAGGRP